MFLLVLSVAIVWVWGKMRDPWNKASLNAEMSFFVDFLVAKRERKRGLRNEESHTEKEIGEEEKISLVEDAGNNPP